MRLLLSNDDGFQAPGLRCLAEHLRTVGEITVVAPSRDRSGASNSLSLNQDLRVHTDERGFHYVEEGTPTDCVHLAISGLMEPEPDLVVSGINRGANLGDDILYSGTVAAAMEGRTLGLPSIAVSMAAYDPCHYETGAHIAACLVQDLHRHPLSEYGFLNVNVPDLPTDQIQGLKVTRLGHRHRAEPARRVSRKDGDLVWRVGSPGADKDGGEGTDFHAVRHGYISITPLHVDLTRYQETEEVCSWVRQMSEGHFAAGKGAISS